MVNPASWNFNSQDYLIPPELRPGYGKVGTITAGLNDPTMPRPAGVGGMSVFEQPNPFGGLTSINNFSGTAMDSLFSNSGSLLQQADWLTMQTKPIIDQEVVKQKNMLDNFDTTCIDIEDIETEETKETSTPKALEINVQTINKGYLSKSGITADEETATTEKNSDGIIPYYNKDGTINSDDGESRRSMSVTAILKKVQESEA